jgi:hypothetical protein
VSHDLKAKVNFLNAVVDHSEKIVPVKRSDFYQDSKQTNKPDFYFWPKAFLFLKKKLLFPKEK